MRLKRMALLVMALLAALVPLAPRPAAAGMKVVTQREKHFEPDAVALAVGDTLRILNEDDYLHHVYVQHPDFTFDSGGRKPGETVDLQFPKAGVYEVLCEIHPKMKLIVTVK